MRKLLPPRALHRRAQQHEAARGVRVFFARRIDQWRGLEIVQRPNHIFKRMGMRIFARCGDDRPIRVMHNATLMAE